MGAIRIAVYLVGLVLVVLAAWVFLTQTPVGENIPAGLGLALILLIVGIGIMASAKTINDSRYTRRVIHDGPGLPPAGTGRVYDTRYGTPMGPYDRAAGPYDRVEGETVVEERRYD